MPISKSAVFSEKKRSASLNNNGLYLNHKTNHRHSVFSDSKTEQTDKNFLTIAPALPNESYQGKCSSNSVRSYTTLSAANLKKSDGSGNVNEQIVLQMQGDGKVHICRNDKEKEKSPDRISLDRRGLSAIPTFDNETRLRLLSLQHNLLSNLQGFDCQLFPYLVFLDVYDNQLDRICSLDHLENVRVLLLGKNRIKKIEGLDKLIKIEVLDLHGNQIQHVSGLNKLKELKVLNLAGNQLRSIGTNDLKGTINLQELNLRRNKIKKLNCFGETPQLQKVFLSNNEICSVEDMSSIAKATILKEVSIDNNPVSMGGGDCVSFLASYLPLLVNLNGMQVTEQVRKAANAWRRNKESSSKSFMELTSDINTNVRREEVISNARTNWELLRTQTKCMSSTSSNTTNTSNATVQQKVLRPGSDIFLTSLSKPAAINRSGRRSNGRSLLNNVKVPILPDRKFNLMRASSQETETSQNTASSSGDLVKLPPIVQQHSVKTSNSLSSIGPNVDSSVSSLFSGRSSDADDDESSDSSSSSNVELIVEKTDCEVEKVVDVEERCAAPIVETVEEMRDVKEVIPNDSASNLSSNASTSIVTVPSPMSGSDISNSTRSSSAGRYARNIKSASISHKITTSKPNIRAVTAKTKPKTSFLNDDSDGGRDREHGGDYLIEICGRHLNVYGQGGLRFIDKTWSTSKANDVNTVNFNYVNFNNIAGVLSKLKQRFPHVEHLIFKETNITSIGQLNAIAEVQGLTSLTIDKDGNPITSKEWESYAIYRLSHWGLKFVNGHEVTEEEVNLANVQYRGLSDLVLWSLPDVLLRPLLLRLHLDVEDNEKYATSSSLNAKKWLLKADPALRSVVSKEALQWKKCNVTQEDLTLRQKAKLHVTTLLDELTNTINKLRLLDEQWPNILSESVRNCLLDYSHLNLYMKRKMQELK